MVGREQARLRNRAGLIDHRITGGKRRRSGDGSTAAGRCPNQPPRKPADFSRAIAILAVRSRHDGAMNRRAVKTTTKQQDTSKKQTSPKPYHPACGWNRNQDRGRRYRPARDPRAGRDDQRGHRNRPPLLREPPRFPRSHGGADVPRGLQDLVPATTTARRASPLSPPRATRTAPPPAWLAASCSRLPDQIAGPGTPLFFAGGMAPQRGYLE
jgi:hypothetical protein